MKKLISMFMLMGLLLSFTACGNNNDVQNEEDMYSQTSEESQTVQDKFLSESQESESPAASIAENEESDVLIAYFSLAENIDPNENVDAVTTPSIVSPGNVAQLATWIQEETGGDLFSIQVVEPYPVDEDAVLSRGNEERAENARPELISSVEDMDQYDTIFLGYPNWWYGCPMAVLSFLEENDLSGKEVYLFCSHGTGGLAGSVEDITEVIPDVSVSDNVFHVYQYDVPDAQSDLISWLQDL